MEWLTPQNLTPWGLLLSLCFLAATGVLAKPWTKRVEKECDERIADLKEMQAKSDMQKDSEIEHLRATAKDLADAVALQSKVQEQQIQTAEIVKTVMASLQRSTGRTGSQPKVSQGES